MYKLVSLSVSRGEGLTFCWWILNFIPFFVCKWICQPKNIVFFCCVRHWPGKYSAAGRHKYISWLMEHNLDSNLTDRYTRDSWWPGYSSYNTSLCLAIGVIRSSLCTPRAECMMTSSNGSVVCVTDPLWGESIGHWWFPSQTRDAEFDALFDVHLNKWLSKKSIRRWFETPWHSLWCHCNESVCYILKTGNQLTTISLPSWG